MPGIQGVDSIKYSGTAYYSAYHDQGVKSTLQVYVSGDVPRLACVSQNVLLAVVLGVH